MAVASVRPVARLAHKSPWSLVLWFNIRLHSCIMAMPLPENVFVADSVFTAVSPVMRNVASSQAENHMVRFALKMKRRTLRRARALSESLDARGYDPQRPRLQGDHNNQGWHLRDTMLVASAAAVTLTLASARH